MIEFALVHLVSGDGGTTAIEMWVIDISGVGVTAGTSLDVLKVLPLVGLLTQAIL